MKQGFTINETYFLIVLVVLTLIYTIVINIIYLTNFSTFSDIYSKNTDFNKLKLQLGKHPIFNYFQIFINFLYLITSIYFFVNNKIKNTTFALVCLFMFLKGISEIIRTYIFNTKETKLGDMLLKYIHNFYVFDNIVAMLISFYFIKIIFFS
jgi:hypothetical protein